MQIVKNIGTLRLHEHHAVLILTDEKQLERIIESPDKPIFYDDTKGHSGEGQRFHNEKETLNSFCENAARRGAVRVEVSYDFFFGGSKRHNYPDSEITIKAFRAIHDCAKKFGMRFGASFISPLDIGGNYRKNHSDGGIQCQYLEAEIKSDGNYKSDMVLQRQWYNNKGPITLELDTVRAYAFNESRYKDTSYFYVNPDCIKDITNTVNYKVHEDTVVITGAGYGHGRLEVWGNYSGNYNRVMLVAVYKVPELDYFSDTAFEFMKNVIDTHAENGISYGGFYSDEMHIQFDWDLGTHFGETEINSRYITPALEKKYSSLYGEQFSDLVKYCIYFSYHQHDFLEGETGKEPAQHIFINSDDGIYRTWLFRKRYFELLSRCVVDLSMKAKTYAESLFGAPIMTRAHATWQESPTCDHYYRPENDPGRFIHEIYKEDPKRSDIERNVEIHRCRLIKWKEAGISRYDYTKNYDWSSSIRENISACYDYFRWNEFLTGAGNDHPEGSNTDRDYFAQALACSFGSLNDYEQAYCASWGSPNEVIHRFAMVGLAYGNPHGWNIEQGMQHRCSDVLALYPLELNYVEERFGSWMTQYGYCNYITEEKLLKFASLTDKGTLLVNGYEYRAVVLMFEPFIETATMELLNKFLKAGGKVLWQAVYPVMSDDEKCVRKDFCDMFGIDSLTSAASPIKAADKNITFSGSLEGIAPMPVIDDLLPDYVYPLKTSDGESVAFLEDKCVASMKRYENGGIALYCGFRPRDDQSKSLGYDIDTLYRILTKINAYSPDSLELKSRPEQAKYVMNRFPSGAVAVANHMRTFEEAWDGNFFRNNDLDKHTIETRIDELPPIDITLDNEEILGNKVTFKGMNNLVYNYENGYLSSYRGDSTDRITINGKEFVFADRPVSVVWGKIRDKFTADGLDEVYILICYNEANLSLPLPEGSEFNVSLCKNNIFETGENVPFEIKNGNVEINITGNLAGRFIAIYR